VRCFLQQIRRLGNRCPEGERNAGREPGDRNDLVSLIADYELIATVHIIKVVIAKAPVHTQDMDAPRGPDLAALSAPVVASKPSLAH